MFCVTYISISAYCQPQRGFYYNDNKQKDKSSIWFATFLTSQWIKCDWTSCSSVYKSDSFVIKKRALQTVRLITNEVEAWAVEIGAVQQHIAKGGTDIVVVQSKMAVVRND